MWLLILAIAPLFFSILLDVYYTWGRQSGWYEHQPIILLCASIVLFAVGSIMLFIIAGWKWGLAGLGISWLVLLVAIPSSMFVRGLVTPLQITPLVQKRVEEVIKIMEQHKVELEDFLDSTSPDEFGSFMINFLEQLRLKYPREYSQLNPERLPRSISVSNRKNIEMAYTAGYTMGKGWISKENLFDFTLSLGDKLASDLRLAFKGIKSNGEAFTLGYTAVAARGQLKVLSNKVGKSNLKEVENEVKDGIAPKTQSDTTLTTIQPWEREPDATDEIMRALELIAKRAHIPGIDGKELTLMLLYQTQLTSLLTKEQTLGELMVELKLSLLKGESMGEIPEKDIPKERGKLEKQKAEFQRMVEKDKEAVRNILKNLGLA